MEVADFLFYLGLAGGLWLVGSMMRGPIVGKRGVGLSALIPPPASAMTLRHFSFGIFHASRTTRGERC